MTRQEFPKSVKVAVIKRATADNGVVYCESCGLPAKKWQIDHVRADGLLGKPVLENAELICEACYSVKNPDDTRKIARAKRREAKHIGAVSEPAIKIKSPGFAQSAKRRINPTPLPPRTHVCGVQIDDHEL